MSPLKDTASADSSFSPPGIQNEPLSLPPSSESPAPHHRTASNSSADTNTTSSTDSDSVFDALRLGREESAITADDIYNSDTFAPSPSEEKNFKNSPLSPKCLANNIGPSKPPSAEDVDINSLSINELPLPTPPILSDEDGACNFGSSMPELSQVPTPPTPKSQPPTCSQLQSERHQEDLVVPLWTPLKSTYRHYLHRQPHLHFTAIPLSSCNTLTCACCDITSSCPPPANTSSFSRSTFHRCTSCPLILCTSCTLEITSHSHRGSLARLITTRARKKWGFSVAMLEREAKERGEEGVVRRLKWYEWGQGAWWRTSGLQFEVFDWMVSDSEEEEEEGDEDEGSSGLDGEYDDSDALGGWGESDEEANTLIDLDEDMDSVSPEDPRFPGYFFIRDLDEFEERDRGLGHLDDDISPTGTYTASDDDDDDYLDDELELSIDPRLLLLRESPDPEVESTPSTHRPSTPRPGLLRTDSSPSIHLDSIRAPYRPQTAQLDLTSITPRYFSPKAIPLAQYCAHQVCSTSATGNTSSSFHHHYHHHQSANKPPIPGAASASLKTLIDHQHHHRREYSPLTPTTLNPGGKGKAVLRAPSAILALATSNRRESPKEVLHWPTRLAEKEFGGDGRVVQSFRVDSGGNRDSEMLGMGGGVVEEGGVREGFCGTNNVMKISSTSRRRRKSLVERARANKLEVVVEEVEEVEEVEDPQGDGTKEVRLGIDM